MIASPISSGTTGWVAVSTGIAGLLGLVFIVLFFTVGQTFGTLIGLIEGIAEATAST